MPLRQSTGGESGSFLVLADDGDRYWCKALNNRQSERVPINEQIVGRLGTLIGVPVCHVELVQLDGIAGWEFRSGLFVEPGCAHGSRAVDPAIETRSLEHRDTDDNRRRQCGVYALHDWLLGSDSQWLRCTAEDDAYYSHDHGYFLGGPNWTAESLRAHMDQPWHCPADPGGLDPAEIERLAVALENLTREEIEQYLSKLPAAWPVTDEELNVVADLADVRRASVAARLRQLVP